MYGIDVSSYQKSIDFSTANYDFAIIKATEGIGYTDPQFFNFAKTFTNMGKLMGVYHFARPDLNKGDAGMVKEAEWFISQVEKAELLGKAILVLDWEREPFDNERLVETWVNTIMVKTGITPFIYGSSGKLKKWNKWELLSRVPIWMAVWPTTAIQPVGGPVFQIPTPTINWTIWQYSANGRFPGQNVDVDLDYTKLTVEQWNHYTKPINNEEKISLDMKWAIDLELFVGKSDGLYHPKDALTREELATVLHRYDKIRS